MITKTPLVDTGFEIIETIEFEKSIYEFSANKLITIRIKDNMHMELKDSVAEYKMLSEKTEYLPMVVMIKPGENCSVSKEVRDYSNSPEARKLIKAEAIVVSSLAHKIMANFIMKFYKSPINLRIFNDDKKAIQWLQNYL